MAKTARRSVASVPLSPTISLGDFISSSASSSRPLTPSSIHLDPDRSKGALYTTQTTPKYDRTRTNRQPFSANQFENDSTRNGTKYLFNTTSSADSFGAERDRIRMEFYASYDVMTGVRIAATLGGFFGLMVFLVIYKSRSKSNKALRDPKIAAAAAAVVEEEEERELQEAIEATAFSMFAEEFSFAGYQRERMMSLGNISAPPVLHRGFRFSSVGGGGYSSLVEPQRRFSYAGSRRKSTSESSRILNAYPMGGSFATEEYFPETDGEEGDDEFDQITTTADGFYANTYLSVPGRGPDSRRNSDLTSCSSESSYMERRFSALTLGLAPLPSVTSRRSSRDRRDSSTFGVHPNIQVIQATPKTSPCPSDSTDHKTVTLSAMTNPRQLYPDREMYADLERGHYIENAAPTTNRRAPLASLSSFKLTSADYQDFDLRSLGSDSVFVESYADTDEDMEQFSTDSETNDNLPTVKIKRRLSKTTAQGGCKSMNLAVMNNFSEVNPFSDMKSRTESAIGTNTVNLHKISNSKNLGIMFETKAIVERHDVEGDYKQNDGIIKDHHKLSSPQRKLDDDYMRPVSYSGCTSDFNIICNNKNNNSNGDSFYHKVSSECLDVNVRLENQKSIISPSVILELPVLSQNNEEDIEIGSIKSPLNDPSLAGPSRKWSKETLF